MKTNLQKLMIGFLCAIMLLMQFGQRVIIAEENTTWVLDWNLIPKQYNGEDILVLYKYKGNQSEVTVPARAFINGVEYQVWVRDPEVNFRTEPMVENNVKSISFEEGVKAGKYLKNLFSNTAIKSIDLTGLDTSTTTDMEAMFSFCTELKTIELGNIDTSNVTNMRYMFEACFQLKELDVSKLDVSGIDPSQGGTMAGMFEGSFEAGDSAERNLGNTKNFGKTNVRTNHEYPYPAWTVFPQGFYGINGPEGIERVYGLKMEGNFPGTIGTGTNYYKLVDPSELNLTEDQVAQIMAAIFYSDEIIRLFENYPVIYDVQHAIWQITGAIDFYSGKPVPPRVREYYENVVLKRYEELKDLYKLNIYAPENGELEYLIGKVTPIHLETSVTLKGKAILKGRKFENGDELTFTISSNDASAPLPKKNEETASATNLKASLMSANENYSLTISPESGNEVEFEFPEIVFGNKDIGKTYTYIIRESVKGKGLIPDTKKQTVEVTVSREDNELVAKTKYSEGEQNIFEIKYLEDFIIRKKDQYKEPVKGAKFAVYGKPTLIAEKKIKITKVRDIYVKPEEEEIEEECPPIWKSDPTSTEDDGCLVNLTDSEKAHISEEITIVVEGIGDTDFYQEYPIGKDETSVEVTLKTGKYRISEKIPTISEEAKIAREQSYLKTYEFEIDEFGELKGFDNAEWNWLSENPLSKKFEVLQAPNMAERSEKVSVEVGTDEIIITNFAGIIEHKIKVTKVRDYPKPTTPEEEPCPSPVVPGLAGMAATNSVGDSGCNVGEEPYDGNESQVPEVHVEEEIIEVGKQEADVEIQEVPEVHVESTIEVEEQEVEVEIVEEPEVQEAGCNAEPLTYAESPTEEGCVADPLTYAESPTEEGCNADPLTYAESDTEQMSEEEELAFHYLNQAVTIQFRKLDSICGCNRITFLTGEDSGEIRLRPGIYSVFEHMPQFEGHSGIQEQAYLSEYKIRVNMDGTIEQLSEPLWYWVSAKAGDEITESPKYEQSYASKPSVTLNGNEITITNFAYRVKVPEPCHPKVPEPCHPKVPEPCIPETK